MVEFLIVMLMTVSKATTTVILVDHEKGRACSKPSILKNKDIDKPFSVNVWAKSKDALYQRISDA